MSVIVTVRGVSEWNRKMNSLAKDMGRSLPSLCAQGARSACISYAARTLPFGFSTVAAVSMRLILGAEVSRVYVTRDNPSAVYLLIKKSDPQKAEQYWAAQKKNGAQSRRAMDILNSVSGMEKSTSVSILKAARTSRHAHVPKRIAPRSLVTKQELSTIINKQQKLVGFAKAGWYSAARALGGRVRTNLVWADGSRSTVETFPDYVRKLANANPGIGTATVATSPTSASATVGTNVRHAVNALPASQQAEAEAIAEVAFNDACRTALKFYQQKHFARSA